MSGALAAVLLAGCSSLPAAGPSARTILDEGDERDAEFALIDLDFFSAAMLERIEDGASLDAVLRSDLPPTQTIETGDTVSILIWEAGGAFSGAGAGGGAGGGGSPGGLTPFQVPPQIVSREGDIVVPFVGRIKVAGFTTGEVAARTRRALSGRAVDPQVLVNIERNRSYGATVVGVDGAARRVDLNLRGDRLLDVIAQTEAVKGEIFDLNVHLTRNGETHVIPYSRIVSDELANLFVQPEDIIRIESKPRRFAVIGATGQNAILPFESEQVTLAQALAASGGLVDQRANRRGVFVFRFEEEDVVRALAPERPVDLSPEDTPDGMSNVAPVVYRVDLSEPDSLFYAQRFAMKDKDILYVANAPVTELQKLLTVFQIATSPAITALAVTTRLNR